MPSYSIQKLKIWTPSHFSKNIFEELTLIEGDIGARNIVNKNEQALNSYDTDDESYFLDLDTPEDFTSWVARFS